jgi:hypothetical protein
VIWLWLVGGAGFAQPQEFVQLGVIRTPVDMVDVSGDHAYVVSDRTLTVFDISNPEQPAQKGFYAFPDKIWGIKAIGSLVYVAADKFGLGILDVSTAGAPTLRGFFKTPGQSKSVAIVGSTALVAVTDSVVLVAVIRSSATDPAGSAVPTDGSVLILARRGQAR